MVFRKIFAMSFADLSHDPSELLGRWATDDSSRDASLVVETTAYGGSRALLAMTVIELIRRGESSLYCLDGANVHDPHVVSEAARRGRLDVVGALRRVRSTRAHTIYQAEAAVMKMLPPLTRVNPRPTLAIWALDNLYFEETIRQRDREASLHRIMEELQRLRADGLRILMTISPPADMTRRWIHTTIARSSDVFLRTVLDADGELVGFDVVRDSTAEITARR